MTSTIRDKTLKITVFAVILAVSVADICCAAIRISQLHTGEATRTCLFGIDVTGHDRIRIVASAVGIERICRVNRIADLV